MRFGARERQTPDPPPRPDPRGPRSGIRGNATPTRCRHLLLFSYDFPPARGGGVQRPAKLCRYLARDGWDVTVVTARGSGEVDPRLDPGGVDVVECRDLTASALRRVRLVLDGLVGDTFPPAAPAPAAAQSATRARPIGPPYWNVLDSKLGWLAPALEAGLRVCRRRRPDVICATVPPASSAVAAYLLHCRSEIPIVLDYRDPWTLYPDWAVDRYGVRKRDWWTRGRLAFERRVEGRVLDDAAAVTFAGGPRLVDEFGSVFPHVDAAKFVHLPNGFDPPDLERQRGEACSPGPIFQINCLGNYYGFHTPDWFLRGLRAFHERASAECSRLKVSFYGYLPRSSHLLSDELGLSDYVTVRGPIPYSDALELMVASDALLVTLPPLRCSRHWVPGKLYEYLGSGRPVLAVVPEGAAAELVRTAGTGVVADPRDEGAIAAALEQLVRGTVVGCRWPPPFEPGGPYDRRVLASKFSAVLEACVHGRPLPPRFGTRP